MMIPLNQTDAAGTADNIAGLKRKKAELLAEVMKLKTQRNAARARVAELEDRGILKGIMRRLGWVRASPPLIE